MSSSWLVPFFVIILVLSISTSNLSFAQSNQTGNSPGPDCIYSILGSLISAKSPSCPDTGTPTVLSDAFGRVGPNNGFLLYDEKLYVDNILIRGGPCLGWDCPSELQLLQYLQTATDQQKAKYCQYDKNGNFWYPLSDAQKRVLMDMQANYSVFVCPFTGKPTPPPPPTGHTTATYSGTVNVMDLGKNATQSNVTKSTSNKTSIHQTTNITAINYPDTYHNSTGLANSTKNVSVNSTASNNSNGNLFKNNTSTELGKLSPLKQEESGISLKDVQCKQDFVLLVKMANGHPACVKPTTVTRLLEHGWITLEKFEQLQTTVNHNEISSTVITPKNSTSSLNGTGNNESGANTTVVINLVTKNYTVPVKATITTTKPSTIKIISVGISSNPLRVGDEPEFTLTFQNISNKTIYENIGCNITPVSLTISPADNAFGPLYESIKSGCKDSYHSPIYPNQTVTAQASADLQKYEIFLISTPGKLDVYMVLFLEDDKSNPINSVLQFSTNVEGGPIFANCSGLPSYEGGGCGVSGVIYSGTVDVSKLPPAPPPPPPPPKLSLPSYPPVLVEPVNKSDFVKILSIGMHPNPLKVGNKPAFSVTYQNISNDTIYIGEGCQASSVYYEIYPPSSVSTERPSYLCAGSSRMVAIDPNKVITDITTISFEQKPLTIIKSGMLTVKITTWFSTNLHGGGSNDTVQFDVNAIQ